jgi:hypothetical protein
MRSAFWRGIEVLSVPESDSVESQTQMVEESGKSVSERMEGAGKVPKNVTQLKPVIDQLIRKVAIAIPFPPILANNA